jgi:hypothetical protein
METTTTTRKASDRKWSGSYENLVESFLDENSDFLDDYVRRKVEIIFFLRAQSYDFDLSGLPDFSWYNIPKRVKMYQNGGKYTK